MNQISLAIKVIFITRCLTNFADLQFDKNTNGDADQAGGDNRHVCGAIKALCRQNQTKCSLCSTQGEKANEKMELIA